MNLVAAQRDGISFFTHKSTEGSDWRATHYQEALERARGAGIPVLGAYHFLWPGNIETQVNFWMDYVEEHTPWWGRDFARPGPSSWSVAPVAAVSACSPGSGLRSTWARITDLGAEPPSPASRSTIASPIVPCWVWTQTGAPVLAVRCRGRLTR